MSPAILSLEWVAQIMLILAVTDSANYICNCSVGLLSALFFCYWQTAILTARHSIIPDFACFRHWSLWLLMTPHVFGARASAYFMLICISQCQANPHFNVTQ